LANTPTYYFLHIEPMLGMRLSLRAARAAHIFSCLVVICNLALSTGLVQKELQFPQNQQAQQKVLADAADALFLSVAAGACTLDSNGCALSPNYPKPYGNNQGCTIRVNATLARRLAVENFEVEDSYDRLTVNGVAYSGSKTPGGIAPYEDITWFSDYASPAGGWKLCPESDVLAAVEEVEDVPSFEVTKGSCTVSDDGCALSPDFPNAYPTSGTCTIKVNDKTKALRVESFGTELGYDVLKVNGIAYSGLEGPRGVVPKGDIEWRSDMIVPAAPGFKLCLGDGAVMSRVKSVSENTRFFEVMSGPCSVNKLGCALSPGYPNGYGNGQSCSIKVNTDTVGRLVVDGFGTENGFDVLTVNGIRYSGSRGPEGVIPYEDMTWHADPALGGQGWKICSGKKLPLRQKRFAPHPTTWFEVRQGNCTTTSNGCIMSPNYPQEYGDGDSCAIKVFDGNLMPIQVQDFVTESHIDVLKVNGEAYSGTIGPSGVVPSGIIEWSPDGSKRSAGWSLCLRSTPNGFMV